MRILVIGAGGVGSAAVGIADRRAFFEHMVVADYDPARVDAALAQVSGDSRFSGERVDSTSTESAWILLPKALTCLIVLTRRPAIPSIM